MWYHICMKNRTLSVRIPEEDYVELEKHKRKSVNEFIVLAVQEKLVREREAEYAAGFALLADEEPNDAWQDAQRAAMRRVDA